MANPEQTVASQGAPQKLVVNHIDTKKSHATSQGAPQKLVVNHIDTKKSHATNSSDQQMVIGKEEAKKYLALQTGLSDLEYYKLGQRINIFLQDKNVQKDNLNQKFEALKQEVVNESKKGSDKLKLDFKKKSVLDSINSIKGLEEVNDLVGLGFIVDENKGTIQPSIKSGLEWANNEDNKNFNVKVKAEYEVRSGQVVKKEVATNTQPPTELEQKEAAESKGKPAKTSEKKKKVEKSYPINGFETDNSLIGSTGKIKGMHVNLRKENGDKTGKTVSNDVSVNLTGKTGKRSVNGKDIEYCEVVLPGENTKYFVAKTYIKVDAKQENSDVSASNKQESSELPKKDQLSQENQEKLKAGKPVEVAKYTITQMKADGRDWYSDDSGMKKKEQVPTETRDNTFELYLKDGQYILEMNGSGTFKDTFELMGKDIPSPQALQKKMEEMMGAMQKNGRETFAITHPELYTVAFNLAK